jgi:hypothetical protein
MYRHMEYRQAWNLIYATFLQSRIFGVLTRIFHIGTAHQILIPSENVTKNLPVRSKLFWKFSATVNNHSALLQN